MPEPERVEPRSRIRHSIPAILHDGTHQLLPPRVLDLLLEKDRVAKFKRANGWVTVGVDPIRAKRRSDVCPLYYGLERRRSVQLERPWATS